MSGRGTRGRPRQAAGPRWEDIIRTGRKGRRRRALPAAARRAVGYGLVVLLVVGAVLVALLAYAQLKFKANSEKIGALADQKVSEPMNVLILGSDSRAVIPESERERFDPTGRDRGSGRRADTIILLHVDEKRNKAILIHFPRDLKVHYPSGKTGKVNGAYQQGPDAMVKTVEAFTGLPIHHYVEVNFVGFRNIVDALGGVRVAFERPIKEPDSGLDVQAGCVELKGDQALAFVRMRKLDDDFGRIARQQLFVRLMVEKLVSARTLLNPVKVVQLINLFSRNVTSDTALSVGDATSIARRVRTFDAGGVDMRVVPSTPQSIGGVSYVIANESQSTALFTAIRDRRPLPDYGRTGVSAIDPGEVRITVFNGTDVTGLAKRAEAELKSKEYEVVATGNADRTDYAKTTAFFKQGNDEKAKLVAAPYGADVKALPKTLTAESEIVLVLGRDYAEGRATPPPPAAPASSSKGRTPAKPLIHPCV
ncbi:MAG: LCP family protein [Actinomycetota bacterium]